jgi:hypothetical protein
VKRGLAAGHTRILLSCALFCARFAFSRSGSADTGENAIARYVVGETLLSLFPIYGRLPKLDVNPVVGNLAGSGTINALGSADSLGCRIAEPRMWGLDYCPKSA